MKIKMSINYLINSGCICNIPTNKMEKKRSIKGKEMNQLREIISQANITIFLITVKQFFSYTLAAYDLFDQTYTLLLASIN